MSLIFGPSGGSAASGYVAGTVTKSADYTATLTDEVIILTSSQTLTLPAAATAANKVYTVISRNSNSSLFSGVVIDAAGSETINGNLTYVITNKNDSVRIECDGVSWYVCETFAPQFDTGIAGNLLDYESATALSSVGAWVAYADAAGTTPVDGTGGSPVVTVTRTTSSPMKGLGSLVFTKDASNRQGQGISCDFSMPFCYSATVQTIEFDYLLSSGTFVAGSDSATSDITVWIYDSTNSALIPVTPYKLVSNAGSPPAHFKGTFQVGNLSTVGSTYRLILHCQSTSASAYTFQFDNFRCGPSPAVYGCPSTDWTTYTPTQLNGTNVSANVSYWRRVGDSMEVTGKVTWNGAGAGAGAWTTTLPSGFTIDTTKINSTTENTILGVGQWFNNGTARQGVNIMYNTTTNWAYEEVTGSAGALVGTGFANGDELNWFARFPISGWSSNVLMSNDTDTRVVAVVLAGTATTVTSSEVTIGPTTIVKDTHNAFSGSTYTVPVSGYYDIKMYLAGGSNAYSAGNTFYVGFQKNGGSTVIVGSKKIDAALTSSQFASGSLVYYFTAGDTIVFRGFSSVSTNAADFNGSISRVSGPAAIAASETVAARYFATATSISGSLATVVWTTKDFDTHGGMSSGVYTCPVAGKYQVNSALALAGTFALNNQSNFVIQKNGSTVSELLDYAGGAETADHVILSDIINCLAGDTLKVQVSSGATGPSIVSSNTKNYISICRLGL